MEEEGLAFLHSLGPLPPPSDVSQFLVTSVSNVHVYIIMAVKILLTC